MTRAMKPSGIEWIGDIPEGWEVRRLRYLCKILTGNKDTLNRDPDGQYPFYVRSPIVERINSFAYDGEAILMAGDGVGAGRVFHYANGKFDYHQRVYNLHSFISVNAKYLFYYLQENFKKEIEQSNAKSTVDSIRLPMLLDFPISICKLKEQQAIADYLDRKSELIDRTIEKQKTVIEKLKLYKQSIITEAVTKGLDPTVTMKPSGIEWIGDIPEGWEIKPLFIIFKERIHKNKGYVETNLLSLSYGNIIRKDASDNMGLLPSSFEGYNIVEKNDIVFRLTDLQNDHVSFRSAIVLEKGIITSAYITLTSILKISAIYYHYLFRSYDTCKVFYNMGGGVRQGLNYSELKKILLLIPPIPEQQAIADYLDNKCSQIDNIIEQKQNLIEKLSNYKKSLIYECVTGKRDLL